MLNGQVVSPDCLLIMWHVWFHDVHLTVLCLKFFEIVTAIVKMNFCTLLIKVARMLAMWCLGLVLVLKPGVLLTSPYFMR